MEYGLSKLTERDITKASEVLDGYGFKMVSNSNRHFESGVGVKIVGKELSHLSIKRSHLKKSDIMQSDLSFSAFTGSIFNETTFWDCNLNHADLEFCNFISSGIESNAPVEDVSFNNSYFSKSVLSAKQFKGCTFTGALFENTEFYNAEIIYSTFENSKFLNCLFKNIHMCDANLDYCEFINPKMESVLLSLAQIPYAFGILPYLSNTMDSIGITSDKQIIVGIEEYFEKIIPQLVVHYHSLNEYFPIVNIYFTQKRIDEAITYLLAGMRLAGAQKDFRMIKFFCKLAENSKRLSKAKLQFIYQQFMAMFPLETLSNQEHHSFTTHIGEISSLLFGNSAQPHLIMTLKSDIDYHETNKIAMVIDAIYQLSDCIGSGEHNVNIGLSRNTPITFNLDISDIISNLDIMVPAFLCLAAVTAAELANKLMDVRIKCLEHKKLLHENLMLEQKPTANADKEFLLDQSIKNISKDFSSNQIRLINPTFYINYPDGKQPDNSGHLT